MGAHCQEKDFYLKYIKKGGEGIGTLEGGFGFGLVFCDIEPKFEEYCLRSLIGYTK